LTRRKLLRIAGAAAFGGVAAGFVPLTGEASPEQCRLTQRAVSWSGTGGLRLMHLTDPHVGWATPTELLQQAALLASRTNPDLVVLTGDYVNRSLRYLGELRRFLRALARPRVATLGNHDHWCGAPAVTR